jgi:hypothetical protein
MSIASKVLPVVALAAALSPLVAHARTSPRPGQALYSLAKIHDYSALVHRSSRVSTVPTIAGSLDGTIDQPTTIYSGP